MFALTGDVPAGRDLFAHAATLLGGRDPRELVRTATSEALHHNRVGQILCSLQALAAAAALREAMPDRVVVAGYSVGEVAAWGVAGVLTMTDTLDLVARRAEAMDAAASPGDGTAVRSRHLPRSRRPAVRAARRRNRHRQPGRCLRPRGKRAALEALAREAKAMHAARVVDVPVEVASHTKRLAKASVEFRESPESGSGEISAGSRHAVAERHRWLSRHPGRGRVSTSWQPRYRTRCSGPTACKAAWRPERRAFLELGPGAALSEMAAGAYRELPARCLEDFRTLQGARTWLARETGG